MTSEPASLCVQGSGELLRAASSCRHGMKSGVGCKRTARDAMDACNSCDTAFAAR